MNILYHLMNFPKLSETFILNEIRALKEQGHTVEVFALNDPGEGVQHDAVGDIPVTYVGQPWVKHPVSLIRGLLSNPLSEEYWQHLSFPQSLEILTNYHILSEYLKQKKTTPDIIHSHFTEYRQVSAALAANSADIPYSATAHAYDIFTDAEELNIISSLADRIITVTEYNGEHIQQEHAIEVPIDIIPACIYSSDFSASRDEVPKRLLTVGRLVEKKGIRDAVEAVGQLVEEYPNIKYHIIGTGHLKNSIQDRIQELALSDHVELLGTVSDDRLRDELSEAQLFVLPCRIAPNGDRDSGPMVLKEAMAMETACVSTQISGIPEVIKDGKHGRTVPSDDPEALATAIAGLLDNDRVRKQLALAGRKRVESSFDIRHRIEDLEESFEKSISEHAV